MPKIMIIGSGQLGSRHLQALKNVSAPLEITVVDPAEDSLKIAQQRYESVPDNIQRHKINYATGIPEENGDLEIVIVATSSNVRKTVIKRVLEKNRVHAFILEKLLFQVKTDYEEIAALLNHTGSKAWVNCPMRQMSFYHDLKSYCASKNILYSVTGSDYGLVTNSIHYIDHLAYLSDCLDFTVNTDFLNPLPIPSKRKGFLELTGMLQVKFSTGSTGIIVSHPQGNMPVLVDISADDFRFLSRESEGRSWMCNADGKWIWNEVETKIPFQSQLTTESVERILSSGTCSLTPYHESAKIHITLLDALLSFLNNTTNDRFDLYPFT